MITQSSNFYSNFLNKHLKINCLHNINFNFVLNLLSLIFIVSKIILIIF